MTSRFVFPPRDETIGANGLRVILIPDHEQEGFVAALQMPFGRFSDSVGQEGCAELCVGLMQKGTQTLTFDQFSDTFEQHGATLFSEVGEEHTTLGIKVLSRYKEELFPCFWEMVVAPRFDPKEYRRLQQEMVTALHAESVDPGTIANKHFFRALAGSQHPAGRFHTAGVLKKIKLEQIQSFYATHLFPDRAVLVIAGDFDVAWFKETFLPLVGSWPAAALPLSLCEAPSASGGAGAIRLIDKPDVTQVTLLLGQNAPGELDPFRNEVALANYIFGAGNFSSRLMKRVRSTGGKTYGISSHITSERHFGALTIATSTQNQQLTEVLTTIQEEYALFCSSGITAEELEGAKRFAIGNMAFQLEGIATLVEKMLWLSFYGRSTEYLESFENMVQSITLDRVNEGIRTWFSPEKMITIAVGKKVEIMSQLAAFGTPQVFRTREIN